MGPRRHQEAAGSPGKAEESPRKPQEAPEAPRKPACTCTALRAHGKRKDNERKTATAHVQSRFWGTRKASAHVYSPSRAEKIRKNEKKTASAHVQSRLPHPAVCWPQ